RRLFRVRVEFCIQHHNPSFASRQAFPTGSARVDHSLPVQQVAAREASAPTHLMTEFCPHSLLPVHQQ
ncbi:hypothetical protein DPEC_G00244790, partial [Dallia pectoralis]